MKIVCLVIGFCFFYFITNAQRRFISGLLKDSTTHLGLSGARISNTTNNDIVFANNKGFFRIQVAEGDKLILSRNGYSPNFFTYLSSPGKDTQIFYLQPLGKMLPNVTVSKTYNQYQQDSMVRKRDFEQFRGGKLATVSRSDGFGVVLNLDRFFKKKYKNQLKNEKLFKKREVAAYVDYRYSERLISIYTGLVGEDLKKFKAQHTPSYMWLRKHPTDEEVLFYINDHLKIWRKSP